ncbi:MAG: CHAT domain-containing protein [Spirulina sp.]
MPQPPENLQHRQLQRWLKPFGMVSLLASSYLLTQAAQAFEPFPRREMQSHLQTGLVQLRQTRVQPLALISESHPNPVLSEGLEGRNLAKDMALLSQNPPDSPAVEDPEATEPPSEPQVLVAEVVVESLSGELPAELRDLIYETVQTRAGNTTSRSQLQLDINNIFTTGFFSDVDARPEDTDLGVRVTFIVRPNPVLTDVQIVGNQVLPLAIVNQIFASQKNRIINLLDFQDGIESINQWYQDNGYILAKIIENPRVSDQGVVTVEVTEGVIEAIEVRFVDENGNTTNEQGQPIQGKTQEYVILREFQSRPGHVFQESRIESDFQRVRNLGFLGRVTPGLEPSEVDPRQIRVIININEIKNNSFSAGAGRNFSGNIFLSGGYSNKNLLGRGQTLAFETEVGISETKLTASLNSPGTLDKSLATPSELNGAVNAVNIAVSRMREQPLDKERRLEAIDKMKKLHRLSQATNNKSLEILVLNNLTNLYLRDNVIDFLKTSDEALELINRIESPALETYFLLRQVKAYRALSKPQRALDNYTQALEKINKLQKNVNLSNWLGEDMFDALSDEWHLRSQEDSFSDKDIAQALNLVKLGILLDTTFTYSVLGDYQAGLYMASSNEFSNTTNSLLDYINNFLNSNLIKLTSVVGSNEPNNEKDGDLVEAFFFNFWLVEAKKTYQVFLSNIPEIYKRKTLSILFSDLDELESRAIQEARIKDMSISPRKQINLLLYRSMEFLSSPDYLSSDGFLSGFGADFMGPVLLEIQPLIPEAFDLETQMWNAEKLEAIINISKDSLIQHFSESGDQQTITLVNQFSGLIDFFVQSFVSGSRFEKDSPEYYQYRVELAQTALRDWQGQNSISREFDWTKGFILKSQGDAHYRLGDYETAASVYESAIPFLIKAEEFYKGGFRNSNPKIQSFIGAVKHNESLSWANQLIFQILFSQRLSTSLSAADAHLELKKSSTAKARYLDALELSERVIAEEFVYKQTELSEIYYGLARAEAMLGNAKEAEEAIEQSIAISESSFPNESVSGGTGVLDLGFTYGYGLPYRGSISASFKLETENPWLAASTNQDFLVERRCATVTQYFECRQKYFDFYISWLLQQHQANPTMGFDVRAFEASEQAKSFSFRRPDSEVSAQDRFAPTRTLAEIQAAIGDNETLVLEYFLGQEVSYLWMLGQDGALQVYTLPPRAEIEAQAQVFYDLLTSPTGRVRPQTTAQAGAALSNMILGPVADQLGTQRLVIVADGLLQYLPFAALPNPNPDNLPTVSAQQGEYGPALNPLLLDHEVVHLPSASTLVALRRNAPSRPQPTQELAFFANPVFNHKDERVRQVKLFPWSRPFSQAELDNIEALYSAIPATEEELDRILAANLLPEGKVKTFFGYEANLEAALDSQLGQYRIVHFASHGIFNSNAPERSGVVLSGLSEAGVVQAGLLSPTYAFNDMNLSATELVVLSGCRTGLSQGHIGREGMTGLTNGLFDAGAERVVASLWSVRDDATRELMNRFYGLMLDPENPLPPAQALTEAQRSMWNEPRWQTPYNWAAFTLQGVWE